jgi:enoyl-CoA hydratase/carnithine racemase
MEYRTLLIEHRDAVSWLYLNRPQALNAISLECMQELRAALTTLEERTETRVLVISGKGRGFCAGADLGGDLLPPADGKPRKGFLEYALEMEDVLNHFPKPVLAAVNGVCCGGGLELALMCDFIVAAEGVRIGDAHANFGAMPGGGASVRLPRVVGPNMARFLMYSGELLGAGEMAAIGLVTRLFPAESFEAEVQKLAARISEKSPLGLARMKALIRVGWDLPLDEALVHEKALSAEHMKSWDAAEGGKAFMEKRKPEFRGH